MSSFAIRHADLFDGLSFSKDLTVTVGDGIIRSVGSDLEPPPGLPTIDGSGCTLLPGLIDSHVHVEGVTSLRQSAVFGVTTVIDMFCDVREAAGLRDLARAPGTEIADFLTAGTLATAPGGHGTEYGLTIPTISRPDEAPSFVDARIAEGSDFIKIVYDSGAPERPWPTLDQATASALVQAAHEHGRMALVHTLTLKYTVSSLECGADGLVHLFVDSWSTPRFEDLLTKTGAFVIPTLTVLENLCGAPGGPSLLAESDFETSLPESSIMTLKKPFPARNGARPDYQVPRSTIRVLMEKGAPVLAGTDAGNPGTTYGASLHRELELLVDAGMTPTQALTSATSIPARVFGLNDRGRIAPGALADMLMVRGNPTERILASREIVAVWRRGTRVTRTSVHGSH